MSLRVHYLCAYYSQWAHINVAPRSQSLWDAYMYSRAVKHGTINGYCTVPVKPNSKQINAQNVVEARRLFGSFIRQAIPAELFDNCLFVPVPSKDSFAEKKFRTLEMLEQSLPQTVHGQIATLIRFNKQLPPASAGGERGYEATRPHLSVDGSSPRPLVLVDDILTTGGTMLACRDALVDAGCEVAEAIVCGKTTSSTEAAFKIRHVDLADNLGSLDLDDLS